MVRRLASSVGAERSPLAPFVLDQLLELYAERHIQQLP
jgi:hypothetical protein